MAKINSQFPSNFKNYILNEFQKLIDEELQLSIGDLFYFFHETTMEEEFHELLIEADIKKINEYLFNYLDMYKFFTIEKHHETDSKIAFQQLKEFMKESEIKRSKKYFN